MESCRDLNCKTIKFGLSVQGSNWFRMQVFRLPRLYQNTLYPLMYKKSSSIRFIQILVMSSFPSMKYMRQFRSFSPVDLSCSFLMMLTRFSAIAHISNHHLCAISQHRSHRLGQTADFPQPPQTDFAFTYNVTTLQHSLHHLFPPLSAILTTGRSEIPGSQEVYFASSSTLFGSGHPKHEKHTSF